MVRTWVVFKSKTGLGAMVSGIERVVKVLSVDRAVLPEVSVALTM